MVRGTSIKSEKTKPSFFKSPEKKAKKEKILGCISCGLWQSCNSPRMTPYGNFKKGIMNIGEFITDLDDKRGLPFQNSSGKLLERTYKEFGISLFEDCININSTQCSNDGNVPTPDQIVNCRKYILKTIEKYKPKIIILFGDSPLFLIIGNRWKKDLGKIEKWRGFNIPDQDFKTFICPVSAPLQIENAKDAVELVIWKNDLKNALECLKKDFPIYVHPEVEIITDLSVFDNPKFAENKKYVMPQSALDFETTGLKPHAPGHRIVCVSVADSENHVYVFMLPETREELLPFLRYLENEKQVKMGANMKFEATWSLVRLKQEIKGWGWDCILAAHTLDNRDGITSVKFQTYVMLGIIDYASEITPYITTKDKKNGNTINTILDLVALPGGKEKLMTYCGYDSINEYRIAMLQREIIINPYINKL